MKCNCQNYNIRFTSKYSQTFTSRPHDYIEQCSAVSCNGLIHMSYFFRNDRSDEIIQHILKNPTRKDKFQITSLGCSFGQEVYSYAIKLADAGLKDKVELTGYDLSSDTIQYAKEGIFDDSDNMQSMDSLSYSYKKYFKKKLNNDYRIKTDKLPQCNFISADIRDVDIKDGSQSAVLFNNVMYHIIMGLSLEQKRQICDKMAEKIYNMLEKDGVLLTDSDTAYGDSPEFHRHLIAKGFTYLGNGVYKKVSPEMADIDCSAGIYRGTYIKNNLFWINSNNKNMANIEKNES